MFKQFRIVFADACLRHIDSGDISLVNGKTDGNDGKWRKKLSVFIAVPAHDLSIIFDWFFTLCAGFVQSLWMISINFARFMHAALFLRDLCYWSAAADVETWRSCVSKPRFDSLCNLYRLHLSLFAEFYTLVVQYIYIFYAFSFLFKLFF